MSTEKKIEGPFAVQGDFAKQLNKMSSHFWRGDTSSETLINTAPDIVYVSKQMATYQLTMFDKMIESYEVDDKETLGKLMMSMLDDNMDLKQLFRDNPEMELPEGMMSLDDMIPEEYDLDSMSPSALAEMVDPEMYYLMADYLRERLIPILGDAELALGNIKNHRHLEEEDLDDASNFDFGHDIAHDSSNYGTSGHDSFDKSHSHHWRASKKSGYSSSFKTKSHRFGTPNFSFDGKLPRGIKLPKIDIIKQLKAKKGIFHGRRLIEPSPQCVPCDEEGYVCNCRRLQACAKKLTLYDLSVILLGGYVSIVLS